MHKGSNNSWSFKKSVVTLLAVLVIGIGTFGNARPAHAQWSVPVLESMTLSQNIWKRVLENVGQFLLKAGTVALVDTVSQYGNALAERTAKYIVTGDWGGGPLVETAPWDDYLEDAAYGATGEFLQTFSDSVTITGKNLVCTGGGFTKEGGPKGGLPCKKSSQCKDEFHAKTDPEYKDGECKKQTFGLNLCTPNAPYLLYAIPAALFSEAVSGQFFSKGDPGKDKGSISGLVHEPRCDFKRILESWEELAEEQDPTTFFSGFSTIFEEGQSDISIINNASLQSQLKTLTASYEAELRRQAGSSYKAVTGMVSGVVITPKEEVARGAEAASPQTFNERSQDTFNAFIASGEGALVAIAGRFISTLGSTLIDKYFGGGGAIPVADKGSDSGFNFSGQYSQGGSRARAFEAQYANVFTPKLREISSIDIVTEFSSCPDQYPQQNNCVIDGAFQQAIKGFDAGNEYTVKTAIEDGLLHGDWDLVPPDDTARNESKFCANEAYCYSNLVKLRRARIIPLGWEIAAKEVIENGPVTLRTVMEGFNDCNFQLDPQGIADDEHPYCHLIDPDWVFRAPLMQCRAKVYGPLLQSAEGAIRQEVCVDDPTCVAVDENGQCKGAWGYCTREKNVWSFSGQSCAEHYASCATLTNREGSTVSYLTNTIDNNFCTEANVGCRAYFLERGTELGSWDSLGDVVHLNQFGETCSEQNKGCTELQTSSFESVYVQIAPDDLGCTGSVDDPFECIDYAQICKPEEVGCNLFEPTNGDPAVAAVATLAKYTAGGGSIISWNDQCDASCVGYSQFAQQPTHIEPQGAIDYFIPTTAKQCSAAEVGCTSFTDLEVAGQGGETVDYYSSLRMCIKLSDAKNDTFYTWEGSDTAGYQLKSYQMKVDVGPNVGPKPFTYESGAIAPEYASKDNLELTDLYISCNMNSYADKNIDPDFDPDCREFFDKNGKRSYRLLSRLVFASDDCHPLRRNDVVAKDICVQTGGELVTDATGTFKGVCIYKALPDLSSTCGEEANGCREYRGNSAGAGQIVFADGFENGEVGNWMGGKISSEAVSVGSSSIHQGGGFPLRSPDFGIKTKKNYTVSFWAKGSGVMDFRFFVWKSQEPYKSTFQAEISTSQSIELDGVWRPYTLLRLIWRMLIGILVVVRATCS